jgi:hypothetical protein
MPKNWLAIRVDLLAGRGRNLWPTPGRVLAVGPTHTFRDLARAIDTAFARWDRSHLCQFTLADGRHVTDAESAEDLDTSPFGAVPQSSLDIETVKVAKTVIPGEGFKYIFDLGDDWTHACRVEGKIDPLEAVGIVPPQPTPYFGWGEVPDQYGRRWEDDDGSAHPPIPPDIGHPMLDYGWPAVEAPSFPVDAVQLRGATARGDVGGIRAALEGKAIDDVLQLAGTAALVLLAVAPEQGEALAAGIVQRLRLRAVTGDEELAEHLLARLRGETGEGRELPVDLEELSMLLEGDPARDEGGYVDLESGDVVPRVATDAGLVGEDVAVNVGDDPDRWLYVPCEGSRAAWEDMRAYAAGLPESPLSDALLSAIEGKGAFRRFGEVVHREGWLTSWQAFRDDRKLGRARWFLAREGIRAVAQPRADWYERG